MIIFRNDGLIDLAAACTLGISVKEEGAIGFFGTGVKFGIATVLRSGGSVTLFRGKEEHRFGTKAETVRGETFEIVTLDGRPLGFTTQLGKQWEPWMAFREFACNALDESGRFYALAGGLEALGEIGDNETIFAVHSEEFEDAYHNRGEILLETPPIHANDIIEIRPGPDRNIYYRGVRVGRHYLPAVHSYNILRKIDLTEDRTVKYGFEVSDRIQRGLMACEDEELVHAALSCGSDFFEHNLSFAGTSPASPAFKTAAAGLRGRLDNVLNANPSAMAMARMLRLSDLGPTESVELNAVEQSRFDRAKSFLTRAGYDMDRYPMVIVDDLGSGIYGIAKEDKIFIARAAFQKGTKEVAATLLEEWVHLKTGHGDMTRPLQSWLFDELISQVEQAQGEAL